MNKNHKTDSNAENKEYNDKNNINNYFKAKCIKFSNQKHTLVGWVKDTTQAQPKLRRAGRKPASDQKPCTWHKCPLLSCQDSSIR